MERDYKKEYEKRKERKTDTIMSISIPITLKENFTAKVELEGKTKNKVIRDFIEQYTYGDEKDKK